MSSSLLCRALSNDTLLHAFFFGVSVQCYSTPTRFSRSGTRQQHPDADSSTRGEVEEAAHEEVEEVLEEVLVDAEQQVMVVVAMMIVIVAILAFVVVVSVDFAECTHFATGCRREFVE
jgi:hypothetical protein